MSITSGLRNWQRIRALNIRNLEDACEAIETVVRYFDDNWKNIIASLFAGEIKNPEKFGLEMKAYLDQIDKDFIWIESNIAAVQKVGYFVQGADKLPENKKQIAVIREKIETKWPFIDREAVAISKEQIKRGEVYPIEDLPDDRRAVIRRGIEAARKEALEQAIDAIANLDTGNCHTSVRMILDDCIEAVSNLIPIRWEEIQS